MIDEKYGLLAPNTAKQYKIYKCPADQFLNSAQRGRGWSERVRSISLNACLGDGDKYFSWCTPMKKMSSLTKPGPSMSWAFVDEHPDSINDGNLYVNPVWGAGTGQQQWTDMPASYHNGACGFSFADGHSEIKKWNDNRTINPVRYGYLNNIAVNGSVDYDWAAERTPR